MGSTRIVWVAIFGDWAAIYVTRSPSVPIGAIDGLRRL